MHFLLVLRGKFHKNAVLQGGAAHSLQDLPFDFLWLMPVIKA
jgi:hypothetical protein